MMKLPEFLDRPDVTLITLGKIDYVYVDRVDGKKKFKRYLLWTLHDLLDITNGCPVVNQDDLTFVGSFERKLLFHMQYVYNKDIS